MRECVCVSVCACVCRRCLFVYSFLCLCVLFVCLQVFVIKVTFDDMIFCLLDRNNGV